MLAGITEAGNSNVHPMSFDCYVIEAQKLLREEKQMNTIILHGYLCYCWSIIPSNTT